MKNLDPGATLYTMCNELRGHVSADHMSSAAGVLVPPSGSGSETELFGGAMTVCLPPGWLDCSDARPVPDHQEVWLEEKGGCRSLIIELLQRASSTVLYAVRGHRCQPCVLKICVQ